MARDAGAEAPGPAGAGPTEPRARNAEHRITGDPKLFVSPAVRRLLREHDVDLGAVEGSGRGGRVTRKDVERAVAAGLSRSGFSTPDGGWRPGQRRGGSLPFEPATAARYAPRVEPGDTVVPLAPMARAMAEHMAFTWWRSPHVSTLVEVDMASVARHRQAHKASIASRGGKLSYTAYVARALAAVLPRHPRFNASLVGHDERIERGSVNLGVAVARADGGLVVPVLRGAQELSLGGVALRLAELSERARAGRITGAELQGGSFTLTNVGSNGNLASFPLLNQPQVGSLAMGAVTKRVVVVTEAGEDRIVIRPRMFLTLTYDHRCADGAASGRMLRELRERLEAWSEDP